MCHRSRAMLGLIVQGLLAVGLCTLVAAAQQPAVAPAPAGAAAAMHAPSAKAKDAATSDTPTGSTSAAQTSDATSDDHSTGIANPEPVAPEPVTPDTSSTGASSDQSTAPSAASPVPPETYVDNSNPIPAGEAGDGSLLQEGASGRRFAPDQPAQPVTPQLDTDKPAPPDPVATAPAGSTPLGVTVVAPQPAPAVAGPSSLITPATLENPTQPAQSSAAPDSSTAQPSATVPDANTPQQQAAPATAPAAASVAPQQSVPATPVSATQPAQSPTVPDSSTAQPSATATDTNTPQQQTTPATAPADASTTQQQSAPATPANETPAAQSPGASSSPAPSPSAPTPDTAVPQPTAPATPSAAADSSAAPQQSAPVAPAAPPAASESAPAPSTPAADTAAPAPDGGAPASASQDQAPVPAPAPADNAAVNPSMPAPQVNEPEPPPGSLIDIFGGYTYLRPSGSVGTWNFPSNNTRGYIASGTYYFHRSGFGVQAEFSHSEYPLGTTGTSPAPPFVQLGGVTDSFYTVQAGPVYRFFLGEHVIPFVHFTAGGAKIAGPKFQPPTWGYGFSGGGGVDIVLPHTNDHLAFRLAQIDFGYMHADQGALQQYDLAGGTQDVSNLRISTGLVLRFGEKNPVPAKSLACDATPSEVYAGERVTLAATLRNYRDKSKTPFFFSWELSAGKQQGFGPVIFVDTTGLGEGTYHATAHISLKEKSKQFAQCSTNFVVKASPAPTLKCSADPSTVTPGQVSIITAYATSIAQRQLTYSYSTSEGQIAGKDNTAELHTDGLPPGMANVTCRVVDDLGQTAVATTEVTIAPPSLPPAPKAQPLCTVYFNRDMRRPARVDNEGRACLDDVALTLEHQPDARLVLVGEHSDSEVDGQLTAAERAMNTRAYLANEKGIDPARVDVRTSTTPGRQVQTFLLAPGAVFDQPTEGQIDESKIKIHGQQYARQKLRAPQKGPVGQGVSHPPKN
jgi:hypothetical protein